MVERRKKARICRGLTLVEVMVALGLIAVSLMLVLGMVPAGIQASQRAADVQAGAAWSRQLVESTEPPETFPVADVDFTKRIGYTDFVAKRRVRAIGKYLYLIEVETSWGGGVEPLKLSLTRYSPGGTRP